MRSSHLIRFEGLEVISFECQNIDNLEKELIEFEESAVWLNKFINLNLKVEKSDCVGDVGCLNNEKEPANPILVEWTNLRSSFPTVKKLASSF
jgi:hypothetical protein